MISTTRPDRALESSTAAAAADEKRSGRVHALPGAPSKKTTREARAAAAADVGQGEKVGVGQETERERLKRHRMEMAGRVWIPEIWGQEKLLKEWIDSSSVFERSLVPKGLMSAREALVVECRRRTNSPSPEIKNPC
ncbi:hypothetical protein Cni_G11003 [Canna indica]|uniref:Uncharacterized protein n=1 Tax=Canna indica TaxID=4628 RepID=A0AAQ3K6Y7_9LILI|nr:hypothetical protein Cni_G11003 [Canna indica]